MKSLRASLLSELRMPSRYRRVHTAWPASLATWFYPMLGSLGYAKNWPIDGLLYEWSIEVAVEVSEKCYSAASLCMFLLSVLHYRGLSTRKQQQRVLLRVTNFMFRLSFVFIAYTSATGADVLNFDRGRSHDLSVIQPYNLYGRCVLAVRTLVRRQVVWGLRVT
jgi:hypothetical protein